MDIQVRYTGSVEQFQNLSAKKKKKVISFTLSFTTFYTKYETEEKCINIQE